MLVRKPAVFCLSYHSLHPFSNAHKEVKTSSTPAAISRPSSRTRRVPGRAGFYRTYASVADDNNSKLEWPEAPHAHVVPTPYQILRLKRGAPYSKRRFYELVKLYHPDINSHDRGTSPVCDLPKATKLERYRLIVTAHDILSDPAKRNAYDRTGAGWNNHPDAQRTWGHKSQAYQPGGGFAGGFWGTGPGDDSPMRNATWEDWEKWYERQKNGPQKQKPRFFGNGTFVSLVVVFAALGGAGQATRIENHTASMAERRSHIHDESSRALTQRRKLTYESPGDRYERIETFLRMRDPIGWGVTDPLEDGYRRLLRDPEVCSSGDIKGRRMDIYHPPKPDS
ncbi:MAG: hypothetical protein M4579_004132 [Chaenotheca gracillima]|nr:MAG: hypothetical protein M4579_004132 [Chaenotheca gracillima]